MTGQLLDFQEYVEISEPARQRHLGQLEVILDDSGMEWTVRDVIEELELLVEGKSTMDFGDFVDGIREQARRLLK